ncbi:MAG: DUF3995 domain-containing protein [Pseudomonadota bacterium]
MRAIAIVLFLVLSAIAALHAYWAFGGLWPAEDEKALINTVIGAPHLDHMPGTGPTLVVAALIFLAGLVALAANGSLPFAPQGLARIGAFGAGLIFVARGIAGLAGLSIFKIWIAEPFATLNVQFYSPLCVAIGAGFLVLALTGRNAAYGGSS